MAKSDIQITLDNFLKFGGQILAENVLKWGFQQDGVQVRTNVNTPQSLTKLSSTGKPRPYRAQDDFDGNAAKYTDRVITAYQSKWDIPFDFEDFRNTYLADMAMNGKTLYEAAMSYISDKYKEYVKLECAYNGVRDAGGDTIADLVNGWGTIIANEIAGNKITPIATGAITNANAVTKVESMIEDASFPIWLREKGGLIYCSWNVFDKYTKNYRSLNGFGFNANPQGEYKLDNKPFVLKPVSWMVNSQRLIVTLPNNLVMGTDVDQIAVYPTLHLNLINTRLMMPFGFEIQDLEAVAVNDQN